MLWSKKIPPANSPTEAHITPAVELEALGPVVRHNHIAYVPAKAFSGVPGTGTGNLAYVPDYLLSAPAFVGGNAILRQANSVTIANRPVIITHSKQVFEGIGGIVAGQVVHQPLNAVTLDSETETGVGS